jgi:hypothetical protein
MTELWQLWLKTLVCRRRYLVIYSELQQIFSSATAPWLLCMLLCHLARSSIGNRSRQNKPRGTQALGLHKKIIGVMNVTNMTISGKYGLSYARPLCYNHLHPPRGLALINTPVTALKRHQAESLQSISARRQTCWYTLSGTAVSPVPDVSQNAQGHYCPHGFGHVSSTTACSR